MGKIYTQEELNFLKENYSDNGAKFCAEALDRPVNTIYNKANQLKLKANYNHTKIYETEEDKKLAIKNNHDKWCLTNEEKEKQRLIEYRENNQEKIKKYRKDYYWANRDKLLKDSN